MARRKRRRRRKGLSTEVELNMAAMLDMCFQLLAFFILTFNPQDVEIQISMLMPPMQQVGNSAKIEEQPPPPPDESPFEFPLQVNLRATEDGNIRQIEVGGRNLVPDGTAGIFDEFESQLRALMVSPGFESIDLRVESQLKYEYLIRIMDVCTRQQSKSGEQMVKMNITQITGP